MQLPLSRITLTMLAVPWEAPLRRGFYGREVQVAGYVKAPNMAVEAVAPAAIGSKTGA